MSPVIYPRRWEVKIERGEDGGGYIEYTEELPADTPAAVMDNAIAVFAAQGMTVTREGTVIRYAHHDRFESIASGIVTEFLPLSSLGHMTLKHILDLGIVGMQAECLARAGIKNLAEGMTGESRAAFLADAKRLGFDVGGDEEK